MLYWKQRGRNIHTCLVSPDICKADVLDRKDRKMLGQLWKLQNTPLENPRWYGPCLKERAGFNKWAHVRLVYFHSANVWKSETNSNVNTDTAQSLLYVWGGKWLYSTETIICHALASFLCNYYIRYKQDSIFHKSKCSSKVHATYIFLWQRRTGAYVIKRYNSNS